MKPDWKDAPEWAQYLCHELDASWFWFMEEPHTTAGGYFYGKPYIYASKHMVKGPIVIEKRPCKTT